MTDKPIFTSPMQSRSEKLPAVLLADRAMLSMERALNQIHELLVAYHGIVWAGKLNIPLEDRITASIDDVESMLDSIER